MPRLVVLLSLVFAVSAWGQSATLRGFVTDELDGGPILGANVSLRTAGGTLLGAATDKDGYYQISQIPPGTYQLRIGFIGYAPYTDDLTFTAGELRTVTVALTTGAEELDEVVVEVEGSGATRVQAGLQTVRPADLSRIPTPDVAGDLASYLQTLPGVVSLGDRGGQLFVRGGTPSQNLVMVDGQTIFQPFHIIGFFSAFPQELVSHVDTYAGGFGARYAGRLSSVIDVSTRDGNNQRFRATAALSPFISGATVEGPIREGSISFLGSVRSSVIESTAPTVVGQELPFQFGDQFFKLSQNGSDNSRCSLSLLRTYDQGRIDPTDPVRNEVFRWNNFVSAGRCLAFPENVPILAEVTTGVSYVSNEVGDADNPERSSSAIQINTDAHITRIWQKFELDWGVHARWNRVSYSLSGQFENFQNSTNTDVVVSGGAYVEATFKPSARLEASVGLTGTLYPFNYESGIEPRLRVSYRPTASTELSGAAGLYRQTLAGLSDERDAGSSFVAWIFQPFGSPPAQAFHGILGIQQAVGPFRLSAEGYYKDLTDLSVPIWSAIARFTTSLTPAEGTVYGIDTRLELERGPFYGYIGYGYSLTEYSTSQSNFGVWFGEPIQSYNPPHDRRHQLNAVGSLSAAGFDVNLRWQYGSGLPYTRPIGFDELIPLRTLVDVRETFGTSRVIYERPYEGRLPAYHRLDLSIERAFTFDRATLRLQAGTINLYDRANLFYFDLFTVRRVDQLPLVPYLSVKVEI
ncbi:MAG: TonB-dependent receptor [Bacteroidota bacterium]